MKRLYFVLLLLVCPTLRAQTTSVSAPWTGVLAASRAIVWNPGVVGGIPNRTNICTSLTSSATTSDINSAITSCGNNGGGVVYLGAGTYSSVTNGICFGGVSNVTLRGAGANQTILAPTAGDAGCNGAGASIGVASGDNNWKGGMSNGPVSWTAGYTAGTSVITLASVPNLKIGNPIILDQLNDTEDNGGILVVQSTSTGTAVAPGLIGPYSTSGNTGGAAPCASSSSDANCYSQEQIVTVVSCNGVTTVGAACSGTNVAIGISPSLHMPNWSSAKSARAWWATHPAMMDGVEDLTIDSTNNIGASGVEFFNCQNCWAKGIISIQTNEGQTRMEYANHVSIVNSYLFLTQHGATASYGFECYSGSDELVENNIMQAVTSPSLFETCSGTVLDYNFSINNYYPANPGYNVNAHGDHSAGVDTSLVEGNIGNVVTADVIHGTHNLMTYFRNYYNGPQSACYASGSTYATSSYETCFSGLTPMQIYAFSRFYNVIGNILGTTGVTTVYSSTTPGNNNAILLGGGNGGVPQDPNVPATLMLWGNADAATGFGSPRFNCTEVPTSLTGIQAPFSNPCPTSDTLPPSFYYTSTPAWWPSGKPWPPIGPDITSGNLSICTSGTYANSWVTSSSQCGGGSSATVAGGHVNSIPAMDCYFSLGGLPNGTGPLLSNFNESTCYGTASANQPQPPTNVTATLN